MTKIVCISDTHTMLNRILDKIPEGDILLHAGDATYKGTSREIMQFNEDLRKLKDKFKHIIYVPGNHDFEFENNSAACRRVMTNATVLIEETIECEGLTIHGSPWQPWFYDWAFNFPRGSIAYEEEARMTWANIPDNTDILITHGPPWGILDRVNVRGINPNDHVGCKYLMERIMQLKNLKLHVFGHIHEQHGVKVVDGVTYVNAAICNFDYEPINPVEVIEL